MGCKFPEHHGSSGGVDTGTGGSSWFLVATVIGVVLFASVIGTIIHVVSIALVFVGIAAIAVCGGRLWWRLSHRPARELPVAYRPQMRATRWPALPQDAPAELDRGQHLHIHLGGLSAAERAEALRQIRGGHQ
jgi:hypothetical protein